MAGGPTKFLLKPGAKPVSCPEPRWTPAKADYIIAWVEEGLQSGLLELAPFSQWCNRLHLAGKPGATPDAWGIRPCVDMVKTNEQIVKVVP